MSQEHSNKCVVTISSMENFAKGFTIVSFLGRVTINMETTREHNHADTDRATIHATVAMTTHRTANDKGSATARETAIFNGLLVSSARAMSGHVTLCY